MEKNEEIKKANSEYEILTGDAYERRIAYLRDKAIKDENTAIAGAKEEGIKEGIKKGVEKTRKETAKKLVKKGMKIKEIEEITGLTKKDIEEIIKDIS